PPPAPHYLLFSDVHLGGDLVQHARPGTAARLAAQPPLDLDLASLLDHYRDNPEAGRPWTLVIAGDLVDLMGMSISAAQEAELETPLTEEERAHGLGSAADHAALKMRAVVARHELVFQKLADFVAAGHSLVFVRGNHDVEFYWEPVRQVFLDALVARCGSEDEAEQAAFCARIEFRHWFYYVEDELYVEHGHQYDEACCYPRLLKPLSPRDPRRLALSFSDILVRWVVRPTPGLSQEGHENTSMGFYLRLAFSMGLGGCYRLGSRFFRAVFEMMRVWRAHLGERARELRAEHDRQMEKVAARLHLHTDKLRALSRHWATPVTRGFLPILRSVFLDLLAVIGMVTVLLAVVGFTGVLDPIYMPLLAMGAGGGIYAWLKRPRSFNPNDALRDGATRVIDHLPARFVVMGHTHVPRMEAIGPGTTYVNLGGWAVDDLDHPSPGEACAPNSYVVIRQVDGQPCAELRRWDRQLGSVLLDSASGLDESGVHLRPAQPDEQVA
ncbi:MAG: metallophosphoesterase, partial [Myxococcales bacterium]|nr:metallophosphoesterase [Myxococcales bacterium]